MFMVTSTSSSNIFTVTQEMAHTPHNGRKARMLGLSALASVIQTRYEAKNGILLMTRSSGRDNLKADSQTYENLIQNQD